MYETDEEIAALQRLLDASQREGTPHLKEIVTGKHRLTAEQLLPQLEGMCVLSLATVTAKGEPRVSAVDGHFLHGMWTFGTDGGAAKAWHIAKRPSVSAAYVNGETLGFFTHGTAERLSEDDADFGEIHAHWKKHYKSDPLTWGDDVRMFRIRPTWSVAYASGR